LHPSVNPVHLVLGLGGLFWRVLCIKGGLLNLEIGIQGLKKSVSFGIEVPEFVALR
jgi:hypothetical protein